MSSPKSFPPPAERRRSSSSDAARAIDRIIVNLWATIEDLERLQPEESRFFRATIFAVPGISCIMPRAPAPERTLGSKMLSWRVMASTRAGSAAPPSGALRIG